MGHIVFGAPSIRRFHLHERLSRELQVRGHRVTWLCADPAAATFHAAQSMPVLRLPPEGRTTGKAPLREFAELHCTWAGQDRKERVRTEARLAAQLPAVQQFFEAWAPDLLLLHGERTGLARLLHFEARRCGARVLWTGDGLLPHTLQIDEEGLDGESSIRRRSAADYRAIRSDEAFLSATLAAFLARSGPLPLARRPIQAPPLLLRLRDWAASLLPGAANEPGTALGGWRDALGSSPDNEPLPSVDVPRNPFLCVLLQRDDDPRLRLDGANPPDAAQLMESVRAARNNLDPEMPIVVVLPPDGVRRSELDRILPMAGVCVELHGSAPELLTAAAAVITVNHPLGAAALLAGTPVVHLGQALYEMRGVSVRAHRDTLPEDLDRALRQDEPQLRSRFLTALLGQSHLWCGADGPDHNGIAGLVQAIEGRLLDSGSNEPLRYRTGPAWPLTPEGARW